MSIRRFEGLLLSEIEAKKRSLIDGLLADERLTRGIVTLCIGGGEGIALALEIPA